MLLDALQVERAAPVPDRVQYGNGSADELFVAVLFEPVEGRARGPRTVEARRADDNDLVGGVEDASGADGCSGAGSGDESSDGAAGWSSTSR
jgi:hypothetical protein